MFKFQHTKFFVAAWVATGLLLVPGVIPVVHTQGESPSSETTNMTVMVKESDTGQPISQAHITLQFTAPGGTSRFGKSQKFAYNAKTDAQGRYKFVDINKGKIVLTVTAAGRQSYGKELQLEKNNQLFEVKLKKPQPLI